MALPGNKLSIIPVEAPFVVAPDELPSPWEPVEQGGISLDDNTAGLQYQLWRGVMEDTELVLRGERGGEGRVELGPGVSEVSFTFDQNMRPMVAFVQDGLAKYRWYNSLLEDFEISQLGSWAKTPRVSLDDKRRLQSGASDIILAYIKDRMLFFRMQRDRFDIEYPTGEPATALVRVGMNTKNRFQFEMVAEGRV
ncbi:hypothetical protein [Idiomarina abyssalis]|uniref:hypothetical protein n=1 Tax=Idiomarina abyssalis TaxID=86102 RepID=UPI003A8F8133